MPQPREFHVNIGDVELWVNEWQGDSDPVLLLHATGFHSRCWDEVVKRLPGQHIFAVDLRFHGKSGAVGEVDWSILSQDICQLVEQLDLKNIVGVGHSVGGHLITRAAHAVPSRFKQLLLLDPVILSPEHYQLAYENAKHLKPEDHPVSRRKNRWQDAQEMYQHFCDREPFSRWQPEVLEDYCNYALHPKDDEGYHQLACDPVNESGFYINHHGNEVVHTLLPDIHTPTTLLRVKQGDALGDFSTSPTWTELAKQLPLCREYYLPEMSHFIPMENPQMVAAFIGEAQQDNWQSAAR